jgi:hypothetical protein
MSYSLGIFNRVFVVKWIVPELEDSQAVLTQLACARQAAQTPLIYVALVAQDSKPPSDPVKKALGEGMKKALDYCETVHFIMEGSGFTQTVNRSILGAIFLIAGKRGKVFVGSSCEEVIATAPDRIRTELSAALLTARGRGMFSPVAA